MSNADSIQPNADLPEDVLSIETLVERIYLSFSSTYRERISRALIEQTLSRLDLSIVSSAQAAPRLMVNRLIFEGEKHLHGESNSHPFRYDQTFQAGVNILLVPDNSVGKSSVMKTIKFALTGDDSDYDSEVKLWIHRIWLQFSIGGDHFTIYIRRAAEQLHGILVFREEERRLESIPEVPNLFFSISGANQLRERLQQFFFDRFGISALAWTQFSASVGPTTRYTTWRTFFQAMLLSDSGHHYLLCDPEHAIGNQDGLILSTFLGLRLVEPINQLLVESRLKKQQQKLTNEQVQEAEAQINSLKLELAERRCEADRIRQERQARLQAFQENAPTQRLSQIDARMIEIANAVFEISEQIVQTTQEIKRSHAKAKNLRELVNYKLNLTGLEVMICPNCDADVDEQAILQEQHSHTCRLCHKPAKPASPETILQLNAQALDCEQQASLAERVRTGLNDQSRQFNQEQERLKQERQLLVEVTRQGYEKFAPTPEEEDYLVDLYRQSGVLEGQINAIRQMLTASSVDSDEADLSVRVLERCRKFIREAAEQLNLSVLNRLSVQTQDLAARFGTESITDVSCSSVGKLTLQKHGVSVPFTGIQNSGERLRVKLAFFLAMMRIGREPGVGRHPGFLLIDQLASSEMVEEDCYALAKTLHQLDKELYKEVQVICFTARSEFEQATDPAKIYRSQAGQYVF